MNGLDLDKTLARLDTIMVILSEVLEECKAANAEHEKDLIEQAEIEKRRIELGIESGDRAKEKGE